jgi:beta-galactosidase/beta-glucuronidase
MPEHIPDYPRPQMVRRNWTSLNGTWDFAFDDDNIGVKQAWFRHFPSNTADDTKTRSADQILVPFTYETVKSGIHDERPHEHVWYQRTFSVPAGTSDRTILHFEGCDYRTTVWINGQKAGEHEGGYERFSFDITELLRTEESGTISNTITVRADDSFDTAQPRGKQRWEPQSYLCWYVQTTGIWKTVWLEVVSDVHIDFLKVTPLLSKQSVAIDCHITGLSGLPEDSKTHSRSEIFKEEISRGGYSLEADVRFAGIPVRCMNVMLREDTVHMEMNVASAAVTPRGVRAWSPEQPDLYDLTLRILRSGKTEIDRVDSYFGMREITIANGAVLLNGRPLYQRLVLDQGYWKESGLTPPDEQALIDDIDKVHAFGFNGLRKHQKTEDERFLYWCDVKGMLVWGETPAAYTFSDRAMRNFLREWQDIVRQNGSHPCIIAWTPFNESWGIPQVRTDRAQQLFCEAVCQMTRAMDPTRPVISNDGWEHTKTDIVTLHDYTEKGEDFSERYGKNREAILSGQCSHNGTHFAFADGYTYSGQPVILSEYGGIAFCSGKDGTWGYGNAVQDEEAFLRRYDAITTAIKETPWICGFCYTQLTDVQQEINGLMDENRKDKIEPAKIREINERPVKGRFL